jgi:branched-chain amino acid transport system permease protein
MGVNRSSVAGAVVALAFLVVPFIATWMGNTYLITVATRIAIYGIVAVSLDLLIGRGGLVSFGHAAFFGLGGYVVGICAFHLADGSTIFGFEGTNEALIAWPLAMLVCGCVAAVIGALSLRTSGVHFIMITLAFAQMLYFIFVALKYYGGDDGLPLGRRNTFAGMPVTNVRTLYWITLGALALCTLAAWRILVSRFGMVLRGAAASERRMQALGFPVYRYRLVAFIIAGMMAGLAGALWANQNRFVSPDMMSWLRSGEFMVMVILGGLSSIVGPIIGAAVFLLVESALSSWTEHWQLVFGPFVLLIALFAPKGVWGLLREGRS